VTSSYRCKASKRVLHVLRGGGTGDNLDQLTGNGGLTPTVVEDLEPVGILEPLSLTYWVRHILVDHITGVIGGVLHGVTTSRDLAGVALGHGPEDVVGKGVLAESGQSLIVNLESGDVG